MLGGSTDIALQQRGIVAYEDDGYGWTSIYKRDCAYFHKTLREAEQMKLDFADGIGSSEVAPVVQADLEIWLDGLLIALREMYSGTRFPPRLAICGGGSGLPGLIEILRSDKLTSSGLFEKRPEITLLEPEHIYGLADPKEFLRGQQDVTPKAIAYQASLIQPTIPHVGGVVRS